MSLVQQQIDLLTTYLRCFFRPVSAESNGPGFSMQANSEGPIQLIWHHGSVDRAGDSHYGIMGELLEKMLEKVLGTVDCPRVTVNRDYVTIDLLSQGELDRVRASEFVSQAPGQQR